MLKLQSLHIVLATALIVLLAGCAITPETRAKSAPAALWLDSSEGLMALKITSNRPTINTFHFKWTTLKVRNVDTQVTTIVDDRSDSSAAPSLFLQPLSAGFYEIEELVSWSGAQSITAGAKNFLPTFRIEPGKLTELGTLACVRRHFPVDSKLFWWAQQSSPFDREAVLRQLASSLSSILRSASDNTWTEGDQLNSLHAAYAASKQLTMRASSPVLRADGTLLLGESFGQISLRSPSGDWTWIQTPTTLPIRAVHVAQDGSLYAGSDDGTLLIRKAESTDWESLALPVNDASVIHVGDLPRSDQIFIVLQTRDRFIGLSTSATSGGVWKEQFSRPRSLFSNSAFDASGVVLEPERRIVVVTGGMESKLEVSVLDQESENWRVANLDESGTPTHWTVIPGGSIGRFRGVPISMYFSASQDGGITWEKRGDLSFANGITPLFVSDQSGYVLRRDSILVAQFSLWKTDDSGHTWSKVGPMPSLGRLIRLAGEGNIAFASVNGKFIVSSDFGKTWRLERELE
jgi:hypothetical protein